MKKYKVDNLGRVSIPVEMRRKMNIENGGNVDITFRNGEVVIKAAEVSKMRIECFGCSRVGNPTGICIECAAKGFSLKK